MSEIQSIGIVGAGFMGSGIAESAARAGLSVVLYEPNEGPLEGSRRRVAESAEHAVDRGKLTAGEASALRERIAWSTDFDALGGSQLVIEAIVEDAAAKERMFERLDSALAQEVIIASNTSSIPIAGLAARTENPDRVLGLHFFAPVPVMKLVEIVVCLETSERTIERAEGFAQRIGKTAIPTKDRSGFVVNFLLVPYLMAAVRMYEEGFASRDGHRHRDEAGVRAPDGAARLL